MSNNYANLKPGSFANSTGDRADWERQILYLNGDGKYAIRSCNCADGTSSWNDAARTHWTYYMVGDVMFVQTYPRILIRYKKGGKSE